jgi:dihydropyrimidinase
VADLVVTGGTVVTATRSVVADVAITDGRIRAVRREVARRGAETIDANGLLVLPGSVDVHTHTRLPTKQEPDRFFTDSVAAAFGGTTTFLAFNNPGTGISEAGSRSLLAGLREFKERTKGESAVDFGLSAVLSGEQKNPLSELPRLIRAGVPTFKAFMVYEFRLSDAQLFAAMQTSARYGGMLEIHCENATIVDALVAGEIRARHTACRYHALSRPSYAEAEATQRAVALARAAGASVYIVHLSCADALAAVVAGKRAGVSVRAETCPQYLALTDRLYEEASEAEVIKRVISPPLRSTEDGAALWAGLASGALDVVASDHVPDRVAVEKRIPAPRFDRISNGAPGIETLLTVLYSEGFAKGRLSLERMVDLLATTPARLFGLRTKGAIEVGRDADLVLFDPAARRVLHQDDLHHTSDFTPYEGLDVAGAVRTVLVRGKPVVRDGEFVGKRGSGVFIERSLTQT